MEPGAIDDLRRRLDRTEIRLRRLYVLLIGLAVVGVGVLFLMGYRSGTFELAEIRTKSLEVRDELQAGSIRARTFHLVDGQGRVVGRFEQDEFTGKRCLTLTGGRSEARLCAESFEGASLTLSDTQGERVHRVP